MGGLRQFPGFKQRKSLTPEGKNISPPFYPLSSRGCSDELSGEGKREGSGLENHWVLLTFHCNLNAGPSCSLGHKKRMAILFSLPAYFLPFVISLKYEVFNIYFLWACTTECLALLKFWTIWGL